MTQILPASTQSVFLAIDTATSWCSVALGNGIDLFETRSEKTDRHHNQALPRLVAEAFASSGLNWRCITAIIISIGPGSFTGLRVGVSYAKGAAMALGIPVVPVSTLRLLAESFGKHRENDARFVSLIPARKNESFGQVFTKHNDCVSAENEPFLVDRNTAGEFIQKDCLLVGEGARQFIDIPNNSNNFNTLFPEIVPSPGELLRLGDELLKSGKSFPVVSNIEPLYLKEFTIKNNQ